MTEPPTLERLLLLAVNVPAYRSRLIVVCHQAAPSCHR